MLKNIRISELQFHLRDENCKVYPATIIELPFYLSLKHDDRKIYDTYHDYIINGCSSDFAGYAWFEHSQNQSAPQFLHRQQPAIVGCGPSNWSLADEAPVESCSRH